MGLKLNIVLALAAVGRLSTAKSVGYFDDSSVCADADGLATCYENAEDRYTSCIANNCAGGSSSCVKSCNGDSNCIAKNCPNLGVDCINACSCVRAVAGTNIYDTCPNTKPSLIGADDWYAALFAHSKWADCGKYLEAYDCAGDLGFGAEDAGDTHTFYKPGNFPKNGTETLHNTGGVISTPVSGATFTWTYGSIKHPVTVKSTDNVVTATATATGGSDATASETGASSTKTGMAAPGNSIPYWKPVALFGVFGIAFA